MNGPQAVHSLKGALQLTLFRRLLKCPKSGQQYCPFLSKF
jgi:hypothetical protein